MRKLLIISALILMTGIAFGQTLKKGAIVVVITYEFTIQPDVTMDQVLKFWAKKHIPASEKAYPGTKRFILIGERGEFKNKFAELMYIESAELRDKYWPIEDVPGPYDEKASEIMAPINEQWGKLVIPGSAVYTDWVIQ